MFSYHITVDKLLNALMPYKSPGSDGLTLTFYLK